MVACALARGVFVGGLLEPGQVDEGQGGRTVSLARWVWRAWFRAALVPLVAVEAVIIGVYLLATAYGTQVNLETTRGIAVEEMDRIAAREAAVIDRDLASIGAMATLYAGQVGRALAQPAAASEEELARYRTSPQGPYYTAFQPDDVDRGRCSVYYSARTRFGEAEKARAHGLSVLDPLAADILRAAPLVSQVYVNTHDSLNRICPGMDVAAAFPHHLDVTAFNFYYLADARHNPARAQVWTDAYVDPARRGWMASALAPVHRGAFLEGVVGLDVTLERFAGQILKLAIPWNGYGVLVARDGTLLAVPEAAERDLGLVELKAHDYLEAIKQDTFKPERFNVHKRPDLSALAEALAHPGRVTALSLAGGTRLVTAQTVPRTGWHLAVIVPEEAIYAPVNALDAGLRKTGYWMIAGVAIFYFGFLVVLWWQSRKMAARLIRPLAQIDAMADAIGRGVYAQSPPDHPVVEVRRTYEGLAAMGAALAQAARDVESARDEAIEASRIKSEFLASVSHEIRTPMNGVIGVGELLAETPLDAEQRAYLDTIRTSAEALLTIIHDILDFAQLEAGRGEVSDEVLDPVELTERALDVLMPRADAKGLLLVSAVTGRVPRRVRGDAGRLRQVLLNLVGNAVKFTEAGHIRVELAATSDERVRWEVSDTGPGVPEGQRHRLFQPFSQLDGSPARRFGGTGLGLSIARRIVENCGGAMGFEAPPQGGARFWFEVPLIGGEGDAARSEPPGLGPVLVVSRRAVVRENVASWLGGWGVACEGVTSVAAACEALGRPEAGWSACLVDAAIWLSPGEVAGDEVAGPGVGGAGAARGLLAGVAGVTPIHELAGGAGKGISVRRGALLKLLRELSGSPIEAEPPRTARMARVKAARAEGRPLALVVEDHEVSRLIVERRLREAGFEVVLCENGEDALRLRDAMEFPLVLLDVHIPGLGGLEVVARMREREGGSGPRGWIVAVTAGTMEGDRERCLAAGMDDYLAKPFTAEQFDAMLARAPREALHGGG